MRYEIILVILLSSFIGLAEASAYDLRIDVKEERLEIRPSASSAGRALAQQDVTIEVETSSMNGAPWSLYILAEEDILGPVSVPISEIRWQALTAPFIDGHLVKGVPQILAQGQGGARMVGRVRFQFEAENYEGGIYNSQIKFLLRSP